MTNAEIQCRALCAKIVKHRDRCCILCGITESLEDGTRILEAAHIFTKAQGNWTIIYDVDYIVTLCNGFGNDCHHDMPKGSDLFEKVITKVRAVNEARALKILIRANTPIAPCFYPFDAKVVRNILKQQWNKISETSWMDSDICPGYGDAR